MGGDRRLTHGFFHSSAPLLQALPHGLPILTAFAESAVNEVMAKRMNKKQQMRWNRATVQPFLDIRTAVLNDTLADTFRHRYPGFRPANDDEAIALAA